MRKVLILCGRYLPGHKDGGPLRTIINLTEALGDEYDFHIACYDRDHGDEIEYPNIEHDCWNRVGKAKVWYVKPNGFSNDLILKLSKGMDTLYLTSFYQDYGYKTLWLKKKGLLTMSVAVASMGVFSDAALGSKTLKKKLFITGCRCLGLFMGIIWSVTSEIEANDLKRALGSNIKYVVAQDLPRQIISNFHISNTHDRLEIVFLSRICEHKNLLFAIDVLENLSVPVMFTIYGPIQEESYWNICEKKLRNVKFSWEYKGDVQSEEVQNVLASKDILILPSKSENFGHVIFEALSVGCIPVISDKTPWIDLYSCGVGYALPLDIYQFVEAIHELSSMNQIQLKEVKSKCIIYAEQYFDNSIKYTGYRVIFNK